LSSDGLVCWCCLVSDVDHRKMSKWRSAIWECPPWLRD
jgi:hypothetical protein